jgi:hypothetical protein
LWPNTTKTSTGFSQARKTSSRWGAARDMFRYGGLNGYQ